MKCLGLLNLGFDLAETCHQVRVCFTDRLDGKYILSVGNVAVVVAKVTLCAGHHIFKEIK